MRFGGSQTVTQGYVLALAIRAAGLRAVESTHLDSGYDRHCEIIEKLGEASQGASVE